MKKEKDSNRIAVIYITDGFGRVLMGKRNDTGLWSNVGGHIKNNESLIMGAIRELKEETGLEPSSIKLANVHYVKAKEPLILYVFDITCENYDCDASKDPDKECDAWEFKYLTDIFSELSVPLERNAILARHLQN